MKCIRHHKPHPPIVLSPDRCRQLLPRLGMRITYRGRVPAELLRRWTRQAIAIRIRVHILNLSEQRQPDVATWTPIAGVDDDAVTWNGEAL